MSGSDAIQRVFFDSDTIVGIGDTPQEATDEAVGKLNEWWSEPAHQLRTANGEPIAKFNPCLTYASNQWVYTILILFGHYEERDTDGYTGKTERLA